MLQRAFEAFKSFTCRLALVLAASTLSAQRDTAGRHVLWADVLGPSGLAGAGYQYAFFRDPYVSLHVRIGIGGCFASDLAAFSVPAEVIVAGPEAHRVTWETGAALTPFLVSGQGRVALKPAETGLRGTLGLAFRMGLRLAVTNRLAVRAAFHPHWMIAAPTGPVMRAAFPLARGFTPWGSLGVLWRFR